MKMTTKVQKVGNSLAFLLPTVLAREGKIEKGQEIQVKLINGDFVFKKVKPLPKKYTLDELIKGFDPKTKHKEIDWGPAVGKEIIDDEYSK